MVVELRDGRKRMVVDDILKGGVGVCRSLNINNISITIDESNKDDFFILAGDMRGNVYCIEYARNKNNIKVVDVFDYIDSTSLNCEDILLREIIDIIEMECGYIVE